jgi:hypothetical protein
LIGEERRFLRGGDIENVGEEAGERKAGIKEWN